MSQAYGCDCSGCHRLRISWRIVVQGDAQAGGELSQEQYAAMSPEEQAAYWAQWQYYTQYQQGAEQQHQQQQHQQQQQLHYQQQQQYQVLC